MPDYTCLITYAFSVQKWAEEQPRARSFRIRVRKQATTSPCSSDLQYVVSAGVRHFRPIALQMFGVLASALGGAGVVKGGLRVLVSGRPVP